MTDKVLFHFKSADPILYKEAHRIGITPLKKSEEHFLELCDHIISQQLSIKAGAAILFRFVSLFKNKKPTPEKILTFSDQALRDIGMSWAKVKYIKNLAEQVEGKKLELNKIHELSDQEVISELVRVKGIGVWTAEMFLMSTLAREDVFSYGDLGIRKAIQKLYKLNNHPTKEEAEEISIKWSPYRTFACKILWKYLEM